MKVIQYLESIHLPIVHEWWEGWGWDKMPPNFLPEIGAVAYNDDDIPVAAAWLYQTDSAIAIIDWYVTSPKIRGKARNGYIEEITKRLCGIAKELGFLQAYTFVRNPHLIKRLEKEGFTLTDKDVNIYIRRL